MLHYVQMNPIEGWAAVTVISPMNGQQGTTVMNSGDLDEAHFQHSHWIIVLVKFHIIKSAVLPMFITIMIQR